jgi:hypothetical protein
VCAYVELVNEGPVTAFVTLPVGGIAVPAAGSRPADDDPNLLAWAMRHRIDLTLGPGAAQWVLLQGSRPVQEWATLAERDADDVNAAAADCAADDLPGIRFVIEANDQFDDGVRDALTIDVLALPMIAVPGSASAWQARGPRLHPNYPLGTAARIHKTVRHYRG